MTTETAAADAARRALGAWGLATARLTPLGGGLINLSFQVDDDTGPRAVLQRLHSVFAPEINLNLERVTEALAAQGLETPRLLRTTDERAWVTLEGSHWRLLSFVAGVCRPTVDSAARARAAGTLLGRFHVALAAGVDALPYVRPPVHDPARHITRLAAALECHRSHRLAREVQALAHEIRSLAARLPAIPTRPLRLVHGDPKISNLLFAADGSGLCMLDLDTLARAPLAFELGDAFRSWCNPRLEDENGASFSADLFAAALAGYAAAAGPLLTHEERAAVVPATAAVALELAARFATDALEERYFAWTPTHWAGRGEHNLARASNQLALARAICAQRRTLETEARRRLG